MSKIQLIIFGQVQGVGFRYWIKGKLKKLGLKGEARNKEDGTVEVMALGEAGKIKQLTRLCHEGPMLARVDKVVILKVDD